jgi:streptomycin 6-kinase
VDDVPPTVRAKARAAGAYGWLDDLPAAVAALEREWSMTVGRAFTGSTEAYVARARLADGTPAVLKLLVPRGHRDAENEITVLRLADGDGCPRLLRHDAARGALLMERLGPSLYDLGRPIEERHEILCAAAERLWRPAPGCGLPTGADKGEWLIAYIRRTFEELRRPCSEAAVDHALECADRRIAAHRDDRAVLVHGDVQQWNALVSDDGFKLVDPDGLLAEPEYDLGIIMREDPVELMEGDPRERSRWLADRTGTDATAIWEWGVVERVSTGLLAMTVEMYTLGGEMLAAADRIARDFANLRT